jgi:hypothetical protein
MQVIQQEGDTAMVRSFESSVYNCFFCCFLSVVQLGYNHIFNECNGNVVHDFVESG